MQIAIPNPRTVEKIDGALRVDQLTTIYLPADSTALDLEAARLVQAEIQRVAGLRLPISRAWRPARTAGVLALGSPGALAAIGGEAPAVSEGPEAYAVHVGPENCLLLAETPQGRLWAAQTLRQLLRLHGPIVPGVRISDAPAMRYRGVLLDIARRKVPTIAALKALVDTLSLLKLNMLQLQTEHTFVFQRHPKIGADAGSLSCEDLLELDAHCQLRGVELVPMLQSFGHMRNILIFDEYRHLAENAATQWSLCPIDPASLQFLDELYEEFLPCFSSGLINIGCDETIDLGVPGGRSNDEIARLGKGRVYLNFILALHRLLSEKYGKQVMCWGDIILHYPELVADLPRDLIVLNWGYEAAPRYEQVDVFARHGLPQIVCPGTSTWNTLFPRVENAWDNVANFTRDGQTVGGLGMLNTDWGDGGHYNLLGNSLYSYAHGAEASWAANPQPREEFDATLGPVLFGQPGGEIVRAIRALGAAVNAPGVLQCNSSLTMDMLFSSPLEDIRQRSLEDDTLAALGATAREAATTFHRLAATSLDPESVADMAWAADAVDFAARKCAFLRKLRGLALARTPRGPEMEFALICCDELIIEHQQIVAAFDARWFAGNHRAEIDIVHGRFDHAVAVLRVLRDWLFDQRDAFAQGDRVPLPELPAFTPPWKEDTRSLWGVMV